MPYIKVLKRCFQMEIYATGRRRDRLLHWAEKNNWKFMILDYHYVRFFTLTKSDLALFKITFNEQYGQFLVVDSFIYLNADAPTLEQYFESVAQS